MHEKLYFSLLLLFTLSSFDCSKEVVAVKKSEGLKKEMLKQQVQANTLKLREEKHRKQVVPSQRGLKKEFFKEEKKQKKKYPKEMIIKTVFGVLVLIIFYQLLTIFSYKRESRFLSENLMGKSNDLNHLKDKLNSSERYEKSYHQAMRNVNEKMETIKELKKTIETIEKEKKEHETFKKEQKGEFQSLTEKYNNLYAKYNQLRKKLVKKNIDKL